MSDRTGEGSEGAGGGRRRVVVATGNRGKLAEIRAALSDMGYQFVTAEDLGSEPLDVEETGDTFLENATLKAEAYARRFRMPALADDSGLEVDALGGAPGVRSSRFAADEAVGPGETGGPGEAVGAEEGDDAANNARLLRLLGDVPDEERTARFRSVIVMLDPVADAAVTAEGRCEGRIAREPRGEGGFGYDPLFLPDAKPGRTMAELGMDEKNAISHRGEALRGLHRALEEAAG